MKLEKIFENDYFIIWKDNKGYDFSYDIENKKDHNIKITYGISEENCLEIKDWIGLFLSEKYIIDSILNNDYYVKEVL